MKEERIRLSHKSPRKGGDGVCPQLPGVSRVPSHVAEGLLVPGKSPARVFACWGALIYGRRVQQPCSFRGAAVSAKMTMFFFPLKAFLRRALLPTHGLRLPLFFPDSAAFQRCLFACRALGEQREALELVSWQSEPCSPAPGK